MGFWSRRRVFVSGCSGLIGGPLCKMLLEQGADVVGYGLDYPGTLGWHGIAGAFPRLRGDMVRELNFGKLLSRQEVVFHLAAISGVEAARKARRAAFDVNVVGTLNVLDACRPDMAAVVYASSNHVYGRQTLDTPTPEDAPLRQLDTYSASKTMADYLARAYAHNYDIPTVVVRNTNCYGPCDPHSDHIVPGTVLALLEGRAPTIRSTGETRKSYLYVDDVARAYLVLAEHIAQTQDIGRAYNVADDRTYSALDIVKTIGRLMPDLWQNSINLLAETNDQEDELLDSSAIRNLGWRPQETLESGLRKAIDGMRARREGLVPA